MRAFILLTVLLVSFSSQALENTHSLGIQLGGGRLHSDDAVEDDDDISLSGIYYEYAINDRLSIKGNFFEGEDGMFFCICGDGTQRREFQLKSYQLSLKGKIPISMRWRIFARAGVNSYQAKFHENAIWADPILLDNSNNGTGVVLAYGIEMNAKNGFVLGFESMFMPMDNININSLNVFFGYSF